MVGFVILHYKNFEDTMDCVFSIKKLKGNKKIIVVDNNSLHSTEKKLLSTEVDDLIILQKNVGFAKANNKGLQTALKKYNSNFFVVLNNDVVINQESFIERIIQNYKKYKFDLLGTKIISEGNSVNPYKPLKSIDEVSDEINYAKILIVICRHVLLYIFLKIYMYIKHFIKKSKKPENGNQLEKNVALHGCGIIFSKKYLEKYKNPFYKDTFLFHEEDFLYQRIVKDNLISIYDPEMEINHKEGASMKKNYKNERMKKLFREKERLKSLELLKKYMEEF